MNAMTLVAFFETFDPFLDETVQVTQVAHVMELNEFPQTMQVLTDLVMGGQVVVQVLSFSENKVLDIMGQTL